MEVRHEGDPGTGRGQSRAGVDAAAKLFRECGFGGIGVAELMKAPG
jgi:AcrR family transcriptional regulator